MSTPNSSKNPPSLLAIIYLVRSLHLLNSRDCPLQALLKAQVISTLSGFEFSERERVEYAEMQSVSKAINIQGAVLSSHPPMCVERSSEE
jgi:hypothetical protein